MSNTRVKVMWRQDKEENLVPAYEHQAHQSDSRSDESKGFPLHTRDLYPMGIPLIHHIFSRFAVLGVRTLEQGFLLSLVATLLSPMRWTLMKLLESHIKITLPLAKYNITPEQGLVQVFWNSKYR
nr:probable flavin-containing monooxygenase 1 [Tanacetum cinerariifolium]